MTSTTARHTSAKHAYPATRLRTSHRPTATTVTMRIEDGWLKMVGRGRTLAFALHPHG